MSKQQNFVPLSSKENPHLTVAVSLKGHQRTFAYWNPKRGVYVANNNRLDALQRSIQLNGETPVPPPGGFHKDGYVLYGDKNAPMNTPAATTQESDENAGGMSESTKVLSAGERLSSVAAKLARTVMRIFRTAEKQRAEENAQLQEQLGVHAEAHDKKNQERATSVKALIEATGSGLSSEIAANELLAAGRQVELLTAQQRTYDQIEFNRLKCEDQRLKDQKAADEKEEEDEAQRLKDKREGRLKKQQAEEAKAEAKKAEFLERRARDLAQQAVSIAAAAASNSALAAINEKVDVVVEGVEKAVELSGTAATAALD